MTASGDIALAGRLAVAPIAASILAQPAGGVKLAWLDVAAATFSIGSDNPAYGAGVEVGKIAKSGQL